MRRCLPLILILLIPWLFVTAALSDDLVTAKVVRVVDGDSITVAIPCQRRTLEEEDANARLIAAAPEMLEALREIRDQKDYRGFGDPASRAEYVDRIARALLESLED